MGRPGVAEAVVVAAPDPKWQERPWAFVVLENGTAPEPAALLGPLEESFPRWWLPDRVVFVPEIPRTATGKFDKKALRERVRDLQGDGG
jgi:fatty-acyl-CoA synthase